MPETRSEEVFLHLASSVVNFEKNRDELVKVLGFDKQLLMLAIDPLERAKTSAEGDGRYGLSRKIDNSIAMLNQVRDSGSLANYYQLFRTQSVVLLVSYFASALSSLFKNSIVLLSEVRSSKELEGMDLKLKLKDIIELNENREKLGELVAEKENLTFQDMKSFHRVIKKYFGVVIERSDVVDDINFAHACRHAIVHDSGILNAKVIHRIRACKCKSFPDLPEQEGEEIKFSEEEIVSISNSMCDYLKSVVQQLSQRINKKDTEGVDE